MKIHFIGIGGIGVSALARYYLKKGYKVSGSDLVSSEITKALEKKGVKVFIGKHKTRNISKDINLIIFSPAVPSSNSELKQARKFKIKTQSYPKALGSLTKEFFTIAISGTHGKSTTTAMLGILLVKAGLDPTVVVGTKIREFDNSNCRVGKSKYLVIEACEWDASFLNYSPQIVVITNIEKEHLDFFKDLKHILKTYNQFANLLPKGGTLVVNEDDKNIKKIIKNIKSFKIKKYSLKQKEAKKIKKVLSIPGNHNAYNALAALTVARSLKIADKRSFKALAGYKGAWRRFDIRNCRIPGSNKKIIVVNDYAHHPTEIKAALESIREKFPRKKIWTVFQPHQYQRTLYLFKDFVKVLSKLPTDKLIITDIYDVAGREISSISKKVSSKKLVEKIRDKRKDILYIPTIQKAASYLKRNLKNKEVLTIMGAGDIYDLNSFFPLDRK